MKGVTPDHKFEKGHTPWNKGKSIQTNTGRTHLKKGHTPWNKGLTKEKDKRVKCISDNLKGEKNYMFGKRHTEEWKKHMSKRMIENHPFKGKKHTPETCRKMGLARLGTHQSLETIKKRIESRKGYTHSEETRKKISNSNKGRIIKKETRIRIRNTLLGSKSNKKGKTFGEIYGEKRAEIVKDNMSKAVKQNYINHPQIIEKIRIARAKQIIPMRDTKIEIKIQNFLSKLHIEYFTHKYISEISHSYQCDVLIPKQETEGILIPQKTIIECDGDFFHMNPNKFLPEDRIFKKGLLAKERWALDKIRTKELIEKGFRVIRLWGSEIRPMKLNKFKDRLNDLKKRIQ